MDTISAIFLGVVQGLTEFLPVSSSAHLVLLQNVLGIKEPQLLFDTALHLGTLFAVCVYFYSDIQKTIQEIAKLDFNSQYGNLATGVLIGSIPTACIGIFFKDPLERLFGSVSMAGSMLIITGVLVAVPWLLGKKGSKTRIGTLAALAVGAAQGIAIIPGISRSGATIVCGILLGLDREVAGRFSFFLSIPAITGAVILQLKPDIFQYEGIGPLVIGTLASALVGFLALGILMKLIKKGDLHYFSPYCIAVGLMIILF